MELLSFLFHIFEKEEYKDLFIHFFIYLLFTGSFFYMLGDKIINFLSNYFVYIILFSFLFFFLSAYISYSTFYNFYKKWENVVMNSSIEEILDFLYLVITEHLSDIKEKILKGEIKSELIENIRRLVLPIIIGFLFYFFGMLFFLLSIIYMFYSTSISTLNLILISLPLIVLLSCFSLRKTVGQEMTEKTPEEHLISSLLNFSVGLLASPFYFLKTRIKDKDIFNFISYLWVLFPRTPKPRLKVISHYKVLNTKEEIKKILDFFRSVKYKVEDIINVDNITEAIYGYVSPSEIAKTYREISEYLKGNKKSVSQSRFALYNLVYLKNGRVIFKGLIQIIKTNVISNSERIKLIRIYKVPLNKDDITQYIMIIQGMTLEDYYDDVREKIYMI